MIERGWPQRSLKKKIIQTGEEGENPKHIRLVLELTWDLLSTFTIIERRLIPTTELAWVCSGFAQEMLIVQPNSKHFQMKKIQQKLTIFKASRPFFSCAFKHNEPRTTCQWGRTVGLLICIWHYPKIGDSLRIPISVSAHSAYYTFYNFFIFPLTKRNFL